MDQATVAMATPPSRVVPGVEGQGGAHMQTTQDHLWGIVLAGGDGRRMQSFIRAHFGRDRPKQYCTFFGTQSLVRQTLRRAEHLVPPERLLTVVTRPHLPYAQAELADRPPGTVIVQPSNRDTGPGVLLPVLHVQQRDPEAIVALLPSDHYVLGEQRFMALVAAAAAFVSREPGRLVLLGAAPTQPEIDYGWIEVGDELGQAQGERLYQVLRFWEKPSLAQAQVLWRQGYVWNTMVVVGRAGLLRTLFYMLTPTLVHAFGRLRGVLGTPREADVLAEIYATLPPINFSQAILAASAPRLAVLPMEGVYWSDWGDPRRLLFDLARFGDLYSVVLGMSV
jgi:mannose-1-phosphate guanylyltransferase